MRSQPFDKRETSKPSTPGKRRRETLSRTMVVLACLATPLFPASLHAQWTQVWGGNFPGAANTTYNHSEWWNNVQPNNPWGDGTLQNTSDSLQNVYLDGNGDLVIAMTYTAGAAFPYTSARLTSTYAAGPYGRMDTDIQNPSAQGMGAAFWALGANAYPAATAPNTPNPSTNGGVPWPYCGELDMMEIQAVTSGHNGSTVHGSDYGNDMYVSATVNLTPPATFDNGFHVFTTEWEPYHFYFYLDGSSAPYGDIDIADTAFNDTWELNQPINFILSSGIGGNGGTPGVTGFPSNMTIKYVNYSQWSAGAPAPVTGLKAVANYSNAVNLSWTASTTSGVTYDIYASTTSGTAPSQFDMVAQNVSGTTYQHTGLQPNTTYYYTVTAANFGGESSPATATATTQIPGDSTGMQLSAGGWATGSYMNSSFVTGGNTNAHYHVQINTSGVSNPAPQQVYDTERWGPAAWTVNGLNPGASYSVRLHFAENTYTAAGKRSFDVFLNSYDVLTDFDIFAAAGGAARAVAEEFSTQANAAGIIELATQYGSATANCPASTCDLNPSISGIEIIPGATGALVGAAPGSTTALSIDSGGPAVNNFVADEDFYGGDVAAAAAGPINTSAPYAAPQEVYLTQRYTPSAYIASALEAGATYDVRMHFAETYTGITGPGQRLFNVNVNAQPALVTFDVYAAAGGDNIAVVKDYNAVADTYGQIVVDIIQGAVQNPQINGLEFLLLSSAVGAPSQLTATPSSGLITLNWHASSTSGAAYTIYKGTPGTVPTVQKSGVTATSFADNAVSNGTTHVYYVVATAGSGLSSTSNWVSATAGSGSGTQPNPPTGLTATANSSSQVTLNWTASTTKGVTYNVFRSTTSGFTPSGSNEVKTNISGTTYTDTGLTASTTYYYAVEATDSAGSSTAALANATTLSGSGGTDVAAIDAGSPTAVNTFSADTTCRSGARYDPGKTVTIPSAIASIAAPEAVYQSACQGPVTYTISGLTSGGSYTVVLHFAELYFSTTGSREFDVAINGKAVSALQNFDIVKAAGVGLTAVIETVPNVTATGGQIVISLTNGAVNQPMINGIEIQGASAPPPTSVSINSGGGATGGFLADTDVTGGSDYAPGITVTIPAGTANAAPVAVYEDARQGVSTYTVGGFTANSTGHTITLHFAELYFPSAGSREFDVAVNGTPVSGLQNFDIVAAAGGKNFTAVVRQVTNVTANSSGQIFIAFTNGAVDQPMINGIVVQ